MNDSAWFDLKNTMVEEQLVARGIKDERVIAAFRKIPRHFFVPEEHWGDAYEDRPVPIGQGQTVSQPYIVAFMTEALKIKPGQKILEVGTGSGYQSSILSELGAQVFSIEVTRELSERAAENLKRAGYASIHLKTDNGYGGWNEHAPYDGVIVTCAPRTVPQSLADQLKNGGRMVVPVGEEHQVQELYIMQKQKDQMQIERTLPVRFVPMIASFFLLISCLFAPASRADTGLYSFPKIEDEKISIQADKKPVNPFVSALSKKLNIPEKTLTDEFKQGAGRGEMIRIILMSKKSDKTIEDLVKERQKGTWFSKMAKELKLDNRALRKEALAILKELESEESRIKTETIHTSSATAGVAGQTRSVEPIESKKP